MIITLILKRCAFIHFESFPVNLYSEVSLSVPYLLALCCSVMLGGLQQESPAAFKLSSAWLCFQGSQLVIQHVFLLKHRWIGSVKEKACTTTPVCLWSVLNLPPLCAYHIPTRAEQEGESSSSSLNTHATLQKR